MAARRVWGCALVLALGLAASHARATMIYRWIDDHGHTHISDVVPEKYKRAATKVDSSEFAVAPESVRAAQERAASEKARADAMARQRQQTASAPAPAVPPVRKPASAVVAESADCATWRRLYRESQACFAPFLNVNGSLKPGAFETCTQVTSPEPRCGPEQ